MRTIWKYPVPIKDAFYLMMPAGAEILSAQIQRHTAQMWALVDPAQPPIARHFAVHGTGHPVPDDRGRHVSTFQLPEVDLVFHLFEVRAP